MRPLALIPLLVLCLGAGPKTTFVKARISFFSDASGQLYKKPKTLLITDAAEVKKLTDCFPSISEKKLPLKPGGWNARATIVFMPKKGGGAIVYLDGDMKRWSKIGSYGDGTTLPALKQIMADAEKRAKTLD